MVKRGLSVLLGVLATGFGSQLAWGAKVTQAPAVEATPIIGEARRDPCRSSWPMGGFTDPYTVRLDSIGPEGDQEGGRSVLGTPGKNIWVCSDWDTILVIYGQPSGQPDNIFLLWVAYSYDGGDNWENATSTIGPGAARRIYPGIITPANVVVPYIVYQHGLHDGTNYVSSDIYFSYDEFFPFMLYTPVRVGPDDPAYHAWLPSIVTTPQGDTVVICWQNSVTGTVTGNCYCKRSFDGGLTWTEPEILMVDTQGNPSYDAADTPRMQIGEGGYIFGLFNWRPIGTARWVPFYTESMDYGATWSTPQMAFPGWPPYPDATCWWYGYDVVLDTADNYRPHCAIKLGGADLEFGDIWECHPDSGGPGNWADWDYTLLIGDGIGGTYATQPTIGIDPNSNLGITFSAVFIHGPGDTTAEVGICTSSNQGATWSTPEPLTHDAIFETCIELASQFRDICELHGVYVRERDNCQSVWHFLAECTGVEEIQEARNRRQEAGLMQNFPNPFTRTTTIAYHVQRSRALNHTVQGGGAEERGRNLSTYQRINLSIYDLSGKLVETLVDERSASGGPGVYQVQWDGKDQVSGVYFYRLTVRGLDESSPYTAMRKMIILR